MPPEDFQDTALGKALRRRKELQETIKNAVQEIEKIEEWLKMYRSFSTGDVEINKGDRPELPRVALGAAYGQTQSIFETLVLGVLRDVGRPMKSPEIIEEFRRRGHPVQGNEIRTTWNRLWEAKSRGTLSNDPQYGYWIAGEPLSDEQKEQALIAGKRRMKSGVAAAVQARRGMKKGPPEAWGPEEIAAAEKMFLAGKSREEVAAALGGVSQGTIGKHFPGGVTAALKAKYPDATIPKRPPRPPNWKPGWKPPGRPRALTPEQDREISAMRDRGKSIEEISKAYDIKRTAVYAAIKRANTFGEGGSKL